MARILVTGAGGFIGHHLVKRLKRDGHWVRGADIKRPEYEESLADDFLSVDLREAARTFAVTADIEWVFNLAADMGGIGYISGHHATICRNNSLINLNMLDAAKESGVTRFLFSSSACVYNQDLQDRVDVAPLREDDAFPARPEPGYGWEKLYAELLCQYYREEFGLMTKIVRFHNCYGPLGTYTGGREKAPAAACRKVALAEDGDQIEIWGDGRQTRSFMYIDDCVEGLVRLMASDHCEPLNLGTDELVTIDRLFELAISTSGKRLRIVHDLTKPQGVRGRNSENSRLHAALGWAPATPLASGLTTTYWWIDRQLRSQTRDGIAIANSMT